MIPEIFISTENSRQAVLDTVLLGFSSLQTLSLPQIDDLVGIMRKGIELTLADLRSQGVCMN